MGFDDTLSTFLQQNTSLALVQPTPIMKKAQRLGIDTNSLDDKDISYALEQYRIELELF